MVCDKPRGAKAASKKKKTKPKDEIRNSCKRLRIWFHVIVSLVSHIHFMFHLIDKCCHVHIDASSVCVLRINARSLFSWCYYSFRRYVVAQRAFEVISTERQTEKSLKK